MLSLNKTFWELHKEYLHQTSIMKHTDDLVDDFQSIFWHFKPQVKGFYQFGADVFTGM
jgi:hypothetical protein